MRALPFRPTALTLLCLPAVTSAQGTARQHIEEGEPAVRRGALTTASTAFTAALQADGPGDRAWWPLAHVKLAIIARLRGTPARGFAHLDQANQLLRDAPADDGLAVFTRRQMHGEYGACFMAIGVLDRAEDAIQQQVELAKSGGPTEKAAAALSMINLRLAQGNFQEALGEIRAALRRSEIRDGAAMATELRVRELLAKRCVVSDAQAAGVLATEFDTLVAEIDELGTATEPQHSAPLDADLRMRLNLDRIAAHLRAGASDRAIELAKGVLAAAPQNPAHVLGARALHARAKLAQSASADDLHSEQRELARSLEAVYASFRNEAPRLGGVGALHFADQRNGLATLLTLDRRLGGDNAVETALGHMEAALGIGSLTRRMAAATASWQRVRSELAPPDGGILMFVVSETTGHVLAIDRQRSAHHEFAVDDTFRSDAREVARAVEAPPSDDSAASVATLRAAAERLAVSILGPAVRKRMATWKSLQIISADQLSDSIWNVLPWRDTWLGLHFPIVHAPSATLALRLLDRAGERQAAGQPPDLDFAVLGDPTHSERAIAAWGLASLDLTETERAILVANGAAKGWFGAKATPGALRSPEFGNARAWCIVAHGVQDYTREVFAGLLLAPDASGETVFADTVAGLHPPPIVVLAVCNGGSGPKRRGDAGSAHLSGTFLTSGSNAVVVANGALTVGATLDLLAEMQRELTSGVSLAEALRRARVTVACMPGRSHPHFFAGLRIIGRDQRLRDH